MKNKHKWILVVSAVSLLSLAFVVASRFYQDQETKRVDFIRQERFSTFVRSDAPRLGRESAKVFLVEFIDPECESCRAFYPFVKSLLEEYEGQLQLVMRYAPFHGNSIFAIKILEAARKQNRYWETMELLMRHQPEWGSHHHPRPELIWNYLTEIDVDIARIREDMNDPEIMRMVEQDVKDGRELGVRGTPTFFVNGKPLSSFGREQLRSAIKEAME
jgi:protein-disulfide isomerase